MALRATECGMKVAPCPRPAALLSRDREGADPRARGDFQGSPHMALRAIKFGMKVVLDQPLSVMQITSPARLSTERIYERARLDGASAKVVRHSVETLTPHMHHIDDHDYGHTPP